MLKFLKYHVLHPLFIVIAPPIEPGIQDKNSRLLILLSRAKLATFLSSVAAPTSISFSLVKFMYEKPFPNFITTPLIPLSLKRIFDPAPIIVILKSLVKLSFKNSIN